MTSSSTVAGSHATVASASAAPAGTVEITTSAGGSGTSGNPPTIRGVTPSRSAVSRSAPARAGSRTSTVGASSPSRRRAASAAWAVPPAPITTARSTAAAPSSRSDSSIPATSVFTASQPDGRRTSVFAAPIAAVSAATSSATSSATRLSGIVNDRPTHSGPRPATNSGRPASSTAYRP